MDIFDLVIIGGGPAGYTAAIRASQLGMKVACIEKRSTLGGTCLNVGCIPSKALLNYSEKYYDANNHFADCGIDIKTSLNLDKMMLKKNKIVADLANGIQSLFAKNQVKHFQGTGKIITPNKVLIINEGANIEIQAKNILIATGSVVSKIPNINYDEKDIVSSTGALSFDCVPQRLVVIGGGYIGIELGCVWARLGSKVQVIEYGNRILPSLDEEIAKIMQKTLEKQNISFNFGTKLERIEKNQSNLLIHATCDKNNITFETDKVLIAVGRSPFTEGLWEQNIGLKLDAKGRVIVNNKYQTSISNIYAVGDVIDGPMLAHKAEEEAISAVESMVGKVKIINYKHIPSVIYTYPEIASVGATEEELKAKSIGYKVGKFPLKANSRARSIDANDGLIKILVDSTSDEILGAHIMAPNAGDLINEITLGMSFRASAEDIFSICHPHPTISEAIKEACLNSHGISINF